MRKRLRFTGEALRLLVDALLYGDNTLYGRAARMRLARPEDVTSRELVLEVDVEPVPPRQPPVQLTSGAQMQENWGQIEERGAEVRNAETGALRYSVSLGGGPMYDLDQILDLVEEEDIE